MQIKEMKEFIQGEGKRFEGTTVFYTMPSRLREHLSKEDYMKIRDWNGICIKTSKTKINECFYFYWGYGGRPEYIEKIKIVKDIYKLEEE